jgi:tRNA/tmRNA/rRNA uracil-C5-methylase (TrmA/RlmC/RlmD family)
LELQIEDVAFGGKGVGRNNGKAVFVPYTIDGETVSAKIVREKKNFAEAELHDVIAPSVHRTTPQCPYFGRCGGCSYQHMIYEHQLELKGRQVEQTLRRIGRFTSIPMKPIVSSPQSYEYRNRITVHCEDDVIGFYRRDEHRLIDIAQCPIATPEVNVELKELRARHPRDGHYTLRAHSGPRVFSQTNDAIAKRLVEHVTDLVPERGRLLIDAYCGAGFFAKHLLDKFDRIVGIDWDVHAIATAQENASEKETYVAGNVDELFNQQIGTPVTTLIIDPPATGLTNAGRRLIADLAPDNFIYISCNPATLARDLAQLRDRFTIDSVTPFDMFPQTAEIEVVAKFHRD